MPISGDQYTDRNAQRFSLPMDSCVGDDGPSPEQVTRISTGAGPSGGLPGRLGLRGGPGPSASQFGSPTGRPKSFTSVPVGYDGP